MHRRNGDRGGGRNRKPEVSQEQLDAEMADYAAKYNGVVVAEPENAGPTSEMMQD